MFTLDDIADEFSIAPQPKQPPAYPTIINKLAKSCAADLALASGVDGERATFGRTEAGVRFAEVRGEVSIVEGARLCAWAEAACWCEACLSQASKREPTGLFLNGRWVDPGEAAAVAKALRGGFFGDVPERARW